MPEILNIGLTRRYAKAFLEATDLTVTVKAGKKSPPNAERDFHMGAMRSASDLLYLCDGIEEALRLLSDVPPLDCILSDRWHSRVDALLARFNGWSERDTD